ncbi:hypothetical protein [Actinoplanes couchii]|uniref:Uncharacterized protein n=1 Tax=Actinoplanes couchii TaxID=403638 RepID=A0ABQ3X1X6_9ACTN|nr:hypothetical protein [Actinoplanes couchii]MDR6316917.1 hypothetical protein [Actinoplanes couchii]GID52524.1 hypothetical protein Aco03nite_009280 [Actinoplanes couchii]
MSSAPAPRESLGLIGNSAVGYQLAVVHGRRLLAVLLPLLTAAMLGLYLLDLLLARQQTVILDGYPSVPAIEDPAWAKSAVVIVFWLIGLTAATTAVADAERGRTTRPRAALTAAIRRLPALVILSAAVAGGTFLLVTAVAGIASEMPEAILPLLCGALLLAAVIGARLLIGLIASGGPERTPTRGRVLSTAGAFVLGGVVIPLAGALLTAGPWTVLPPAFLVPLTALVLTFVVAAQAGILAHIGLLHTAAQDPVDPPLPETESPETETAETEAPRAGAVRRPWFAVAAVIVVLALPVGVAALNPLGAPVVRSHGDVPSGVAAVAWPAGQHPVIATISGARFCDDDLCDRHVTRNGGPSVYDGYGTAAISTDGTAVVKAALTGGADTGGPFVHYTVCTRSGCPEQWFPVRASAGEPSGWSDLAAAVAPDQAVWFGLAAVPEEDANRYEITLIRCPDASCSRPERHRAGTVDRDPEDSFAGRRRISLSIGADGRPVLMIRTGTVATVVTCDPVTCAAPRTTSAFAGTSGTTWDTLAGDPATVIAFDPGRLQFGEQLITLDSGRTAAWSGAVASEGSHVYATAAEQADPPGLHVTISTDGEPAEPGYWRQILWRCDQNGCSRQALDGMTESWGREGLAVSGDGQVLIVRQDRILLFTP